MNTEQQWADAVARTIMDAVAPLALRISELETYIAQSEQQHIQQATDTRAAVTAGLEAVDGRWAALADSIQRGLSDA